MAKWQCTKCGIKVDGITKALGGGKCPSTPTGNHIWQQLYKAFTRFFKV